MPNAMRMPTYNTPRIISCSDETEEYLCLPRGCEEDITNMLNELDVEADWIDKVNSGRKYRRAISRGIKRRTANCGK